MAAWPFTGALLQPQDRIAASVSVGGRPPEAGVVPARATPQAPLPLHAWVLSRRRAGRRRRGVIRVGRMSDTVTIGTATLHLGDCREVMPECGPVDAIVTDPPYGETSLAWDRRVEGWLPIARRSLAPTGSMWVFGSMKFFRETSAEFDAAGWKFAQDVVWEKHNGSSFHADRFKRVHENAVQFYPADRPWAEVFKKPVTTPDATARTVRRKKRPPHTGHIEAGSYESFDGGPRLMRSVIYARSCHGYAVHPTQKPVEIVDPLVEYSCPPGGIVADWFAGSGTTAAVCMRRGLRFVGCEIDPERFDVACQRLEDEIRAMERPQQLGLLGT